MNSRPFSFLEINTIHHKDCLDLINEMPDAFLDGIITDFPYGIDFQSNQRVKSEKFEKIANDKEPFIDWIIPSLRVLKEGGRFICFYRWDVQNELVSEIEKAGYTIKSQLVWDKVVHGMGDLKGEFSPSHELMIYATKGRYEFTSKRPTTVYKCKRVDTDKIVHPNEKPVQLFSAILRDIMNKGELVADFFSGSGALACAAKIDGIDFIACDLEEKYVKLGKERLGKSNKAIFI